MMRVLIADDEAAARDRLRGLLRAERDVVVVAECAEGLETLEAIKRLRPHAVFLDIGMPEMDGLDVVRALGRSSPPAIVLVSAHDRFGPNAFDVGVVDYLLKPFDKARFDKALGRARAAIEHPNNVEAIEALSKALALARLPTTKPRLQDRLAVRSGNRVVLVSPSDIDWIQSADNYSELHVGPATYLIRETLGALMEQLPVGQFWRISRSLLVNTDRVREIRPKSHGDYWVVLADGSTLAASRKFRSPLNAK